MATITTMVNETTGNTVLAEFLVSDCLIQNATFLDQHGQELRGREIFINANLKVLTSNVPNHPNKIFETLDPSDDVFWN